MQRTPVLIIGGSLVGLSASLFLSWRGVPHILVDKHRGSSPHPRALGFTETTIEHYRSAGIADRIPQTPAGTRLRRVRTESLTADWIAETDWTPGQATDRSSSLSPCSGAAVAQDKLEPILRDGALARGAELRLGTEMTAFRQTADGVVARMRDRSGGDYEIVADYMIAADGAESTVREALGITRSGVGHLRTLRSVLFRCPGADPFLERGPRQFEIRQPDFAAFLTTYGDSRWVLMFDDDRERSEAELREAVARSLGRDLAFELVAAGRWDMAGRIADRYAAGRVFLAGDAAHQLPPTRGGFGANTGIDDAWNLAWKLGRVLAGTSLPTLLDTYGEERRPIGWLRHQQTFSRPDYAGWVGPGFAAEPLFDNDAMEFGQLVRSAAILGAGRDLPPAAHPGAWAGQPGTRAPHAWVEQGGASRSTLDLFSRDFVLMSADPLWCDAARQAAEACRTASAPTVYRVGHDVTFADESAFGRLFGVGEDGATLIRPDGIVCWRAQAMPDDPTGILRDAFMRVAALPA